MKLFLKPLYVFPYAYVHVNYRLVSTDGVRLRLNIRRDVVTLTYARACALLRQLPWWLQQVLIFVCIEYGYYWFHRFAHEWNAMWAAHVAHHSSEEYNLTTATRQGA